MCELLEYDAKNSPGLWRSFMRLRILLDVRKPLLRSKKLRKEGGAPVTVAFKYEKLGSFYYLCGLIGHNDATCRMLLTIRNDTRERGWGPEIRVDMRPSTAIGGARWLREEGTVGSSNQGRHSRRNYWEGAGAFNPLNADPTVTGGAIITPQMINAFKDPGTLFSKNQNIPSKEPRAVSVANDSPDQQMIDQESTICDVAEVEKNDAEIRQTIQYRMIIFPMHNLVLTMVLWLPLLSLMMVLFYW